jgi:hypothetical protein
MFGAGAYDPFELRSHLLLSLDPALLDADGGRERMMLPVHSGIMALLVNGEKQYFDQSPYKEADDGDDVRSIAGDGSGDKWSGSSSTPTSNSAPLIDEMGERRMLMRKKAAAHGIPKGVVYLGPTRHGTDSWSVGEYDSKGGSLPRAHQMYYLQVQYTVSCTQ